MKKIIILFSLIILGININAQESPENKLGAWYMFNGSHKLSDKFAIKSMAHFRYYEFASEFQQEIYRLGINYTFNPKINLTVGYSFVNTDTSYRIEEGYVDENRIYEDLNISGKFKTLKLKHRIRLEHRFLNSSTSNWFRYDLNVNYPLSDEWSIYAFNEIFLNIDKSKRFVQNWTGTGALYKLNKNLKFKLGYLYIKLPDDGFHRMQIGVILNTNHSKK